MGRPFRLGLNLNRRGRSLRFEPLEQLPRTLFEMAGFQQNVRFLKLVRCLIVGTTRRWQSLKGLLHVHRHFLVTLGSPVLNIGSQGDPVRNARVSKAEILVCLRFPREWRL